MEKLTLDQKFVKYKDMWSCMSDEQYDKVGNSNWWLNEDDVKEAIKNTIKTINETIEANNGVTVENLAWIVKDFKENFGDALLGAAE